VIGPAEDVSSHLVVYRGRQVTPSLMVALNEGRSQLVSMLVLVGLRKYEKGDMQGTALVGMQRDRAVQCWVPIRSKREM
jgi:hypothetical protein